MEDEKLENKVGLYLERIVDRGQGDYELKEEGFWEIFGGRTEEGFRFSIRDNLLKGRFVDVVAYAVQNKGFYAEWLSNESKHSNPGNHDNGFVRKIHGEVSNYNDLDKLLNTDSLERLSEIYK